MGVHDVLAIMGAHTAVISSFAIWTMAAKGNRGNPFQCLCLAVATQSRRRAGRANPRSLTSPTSYGWQAN